MENRNSFGKLPVSALRYFDFSGQCPAGKTRRRLTERDSRVRVINHDGDQASPFSADLVAAAARDGTPVNPKAMYFDYARG